MEFIKRKSTKTLNNKGRFELKLITYLISLFLFILYLIVINKVSTVYSLGPMVFLLSWFGILTFIYIIYTWYKITGQLFTPYIIFILFFFMFNYGQPLMWAIGIHIPEEIGQSPIYPGHGIAEESDILKTQIYVLICAWMLHFGALIAVKNKRNRIGVESLPRDKDQDKITLNIIFKVSLVFAIISVPVTLWANFQDLQVARTYGYRALYYSEFARRGASIEGFFTLWFFPSLLGLLIGSRYNKKVKIAVYLIMIVFILLHVAAGDRHPFVYKIFILLWLSHVAYKPIRKKTALMYILIAIVSIYFLDVIVSLRNSGISITKIIDSLSLSNSSVIKVIFEMGSSMTPTLYLLKYGGDFWEYGNSYLLALGGLITNKFLELFDIPYGVISRHFGDYLNLPWGPGFSILAEPLLNFGLVFAPLFMIIIGFLVSKLFYVDKDMMSSISPLKFLFVGASLDALMRLNRDSVHVPVKNWFYGVVLFCIIIYLLREWNLKKRRTNN